MKMRFLACLAVLFPLVAVASPNFKEGRKLVQTHRPAMANS